MSRPKIHYSVVVKNHVSGEALRVELVDLPFPSRSYRLRVNGRYAEKFPVGGQVGGAGAGAAVVGGSLMGRVW